MEQGRRGNGGNDLNAFRIEPMKTSVAALRVALLSSALLVAGGCSRTARVQTKVSEKPIGTVIEVKAPLGLPPVPVPADNPVTAQTVALGRTLFYDKKL